MNNPFDRVILNLREKPLSSDINRAQAQLDYAMRLMAESMFGKRTSDSSESKATPTGFFGNDLRVVPSAAPDLFVTVRRGLGYFNGSADTPNAIGGVLGLDDLSPLKPVVLMADTVFAVPTPPGANSRIDIIEARVNRDTKDPATRLILDPTTGAFVPSTVNKTLQFILDGSVGTVIDPALSVQALSYKTGVVGAVPVEPTVTPGYVKVARINVGTSVVSIDKNAIADRRPLLGVGGVLRASMRFRLQFNGGAPIVTVINVVAPAGVQMCAKGTVVGGEHGSAEVYCSGGEIAKAVLRSTVESSAGGAPSFNALTGNIGRQSTSNINGGFLAQLAATDQTQMAAATPAVSIGLGQQRVGAKVNAVHHSGVGVMSVTDAELDDVIYNVEFDLSY